MIVFRDGQSQKSKELIVIQLLQDSRQYKNDDKKTSEFLRDRAKAILLGIK